MKKQTETTSHILSSKVRIAKFILQQGETSKSEIAKELKISMPTILLSTKELIDEKIIKEVGEYESTGGRKAKILTIVQNKKYSAGIDITANHVSFVIINLIGTIICNQRIRVPFSNTDDYYQFLVSTLDNFIVDSKIPRKKILGLGISIPGIVSTKDNILVKSHVLQLNNLDLNKIGTLFNFPVCFENDANCAAMAELKYVHQNAIYLSLSNSVGGSIFMNHNIYYGDNYRSAEFGHFIINPDGKKCYCGKHGCVDVYCSARVLRQTPDQSLEDFFENLDVADYDAIKLWDTYLEYLAITITNLRVAFDCDIILGGYVGGYLNKYATVLGKRVLKYSLFETDTNFLKICKFKKEASAIGIAMHFVEEFFNNIK